MHPSTAINQGFQKTIRFLVNRKEYWCPVDSQWSINCWPMKNAFIWKETIKESFKIINFKTHYNISIIIHSAINMRILFKININGAKDYFLNQSNPLKSQFQFLIARYCGKEILDAKFFKTFMLFINQFLSKCSAPDRLNNPF